MIEETKYECSYNIKVGNKIVDSIMKDEAKDCKINRIKFSN